MTMMLKILGFHTDLPGHRSTWSFSVLRLASLGFNLSSSRNCTVLCSYLITNIRKQQFGIFKICFLKNREDSTEILHRYIIQKSLSTVKLGRMEGNTEEQCCWGNWTELRTLTIPINLVLTCRCYSLNMSKRVHCAEVKMSLGSGIFLLSNV